MHEAALVQTLVDEACAAARRAGLRRVRRVAVWIADPEAIVPEVVEAHFAERSAGTPLEGAQLAVTIRRVEARCEACGARYAPTAGMTLCPRCGSPEGRLDGPCGVGLEAIEG